MPYSINISGRHRHAGELFKASRDGVQATSVASDVGISVNTANRSIGLACYDMPERISIWVAFQSS